MIRKPIAFPDGKPLTRALAAQLVQIISMISAPELPTILNVQQIPHATW